MADQSSGTPRPLGARPFARPYIGATTPGQPKDAKSSPARPALPPFAPPAISAPLDPSDVDGQGALMPPVAFLAVEQGGLGAPVVAAGEELSSREASPGDPAVVAADAAIPEPNETVQSSTDESHSEVVTFPVVASREIWTPEWTPVVVPDVTTPVDLAYPVSSSEVTTESQESAISFYDSPTLEAQAPASPAASVAPSEEVVPLFRETETESGTSDDLPTPLGHWTDAPSAEGAGADFERMDARMDADDSAFASTMDDVSGSLDDRAVEQTPLEALSSPDDRVVGAEAPASQAVVAAERGGVSKERQYADVLEAVAARVRAGEIQLPVAPGADDEAAILATVLASLLSSR